MKKLLSSIIAILIVIAVLCLLFHLLKSNNILDIDSYFDSIKDSITGSSSSSEEIDESIKIILELEHIEF